MLGDGIVKQVYTMSGEKRSIREIARTLGISRNTVRKYLRSPELPKPAPRPPRESKLDPYKEYIMERLDSGEQNCAALLRKLREEGYEGSYTILKDFVKPFRRRPESKQTVRYETEPGEQAQVDFGCCKYIGADGTTRRIWVFVMVLSWSRAMYVEFVKKTNLATFIRCHINAFEHFGGVPHKCLYDNTKVVVLGRDDAGHTLFNMRFMDFALRLGFDIQLCHPYRPQTKGRVERAIRYVKDNFWPGVEFVDLEDLNRQVTVWRDTVADVRIHGTTHERPIDRLAVEKACLSAVPPIYRLKPFLRENRKIGRDGFVRWEKALYGVPMPWTPGQVVQVHAEDDRIEIWMGDQRIAVHPRATRPGQQLKHPRQWAGIDSGNSRPRKEPVAVQIASVEVQRRPLQAYDQFIAEGVRW